MNKNKKIPVKKYRNIARSSYNQRLNKDYSSINQAIGDNLNLLTRVSNYVHEYMMFDEQHRKLHDELFIVCPSCDEHSEGTMYIKPVDLTCINRKSKIVHLYAALRMIQENLRYYQAIASGRHKSCNEYNENDDSWDVCGLCGLESEACITIDHAQTGEEIMMCVEFMRKEIGWDYHLELL